MDRNFGENNFFDNQSRFVIQDYANKRPFASFLPGIAGTMGIPLWVFYVNRGQAITSFGIADKNHPMMEFQSANKAYQTTPYTGFRTFIKLHGNKGDHFYEPFAPWTQQAARQMHIGMNELEIQEYASKHHLQTNIVYFTLPRENFAGLVRSTTLKNCHQEPISVEILDGMPAMIPYGVNNFQLKEFGRTIEAWMEVYNLDHNIPFYRVRASIEDKAEVETFLTGHFSLAFVNQQGESQLCSTIVDPRIVFDENTTLCAPDHFRRASLYELLQENQITCGRTPCSFFGGQYTINPSESITIHSIYGNVSSLEMINNEYPRLLKNGFIEEKRQEAYDLAQSLTAPIETSSSSPVFDTYCRQTYLDNILRGGYPKILKTKDRSYVYHIYSRKHGDTERDYNAFYLAPEYYSQGNGNFRDVNQNRRSDILFNPEVDDFNIYTFMSLIQADGYNPLVVEGSQFTVPTDQLETVLKLVGAPEKLKSVLSKPFTPGGLIKFIAEHEISFSVSTDEFLSLVLQYVEQIFQADFHEGYWIDHWTYNLDLIESFLVVYPDRKEKLLFEEPKHPFYDSKIQVNPRNEKFVLSNGKPHQLNAIFENKKKKALIEGRDQLPHLLRAQNGEGDIYCTTLYTKLWMLALIKFATMDPGGMGIEMEAGRPGWYDAMNGLPALFGSSMPETFELKRLLLFLLEAIGEYPTKAIEIPIEANELLETILQNLANYHANSATDQDHTYWNEVSQAREQYRSQIEMGIDGQLVSTPSEKLADSIQQFIQKVDLGIQRALETNDGVPPTYFRYQVDDFEMIQNSDGQLKTDPEGRPNIRIKKFTPIPLPIFLEGFVRALKVAPRETAHELYQKVRSSSLFDKKLKMYRVNASLENQPHDIGRARAFTPGWLENESIWLHMEYKYLLEVLKSGLYDSFFDDLQNTLIPFLNPETYGRSPTENSSFLVSSVHPDASLHGAGFVARLSGSTAEFLSMWQIMMAGASPFFIEDGQLYLQFQPVLPGWLFDDGGKITFRFLGNCWVTYHNPYRKNTYQDNVTISKTILAKEDQEKAEFEGNIIPSHFAGMVREGKIKRIDLYIE